MSFRMQPARGDPSRNSGIAAFGSRFAAFLAMAIALLPLLARATVVFDVSADERSLTITQRGDDTAYFPQAYFLDANGGWQHLTAARRHSQLAKDEAARYEHRPVSVENPSGVLQIRYFDRAGFGFGQLAFTAQWPGLTMPFQTQVDHERLGIKGLANDVVATWVLWTARDDARHDRFDLPRPPAPALGLSWGERRDRDAGVVMGHEVVLPPSPGNVVLLHEREPAEGVPTFAVQQLPPLPDAPYPYRPTWLESSRWHYAMAIFFLGLALAGAIPTWWRCRR